MSIAKNEKLTRYHIAYPSGRKFELVGVFSVVDIPPLRAPAIDTGERVMLLDQRAIVTRGGKRVYHPRQNMDGLTTEMRDWLKANPSW
jgi:hypothetical protein